MMSKREEGLAKTRRIVFTGLLFAIAMVLSYVESSLPPVMAFAPGLKLGLSNIVVMYTLFFINTRHAYLMALLKAMFVYSIRGMMAGIISFAGGILSVTAMGILLFLFREKISYLILSIIGAVAHNIGQVFAVALFYSQFTAWAYLPVLIIGGVVAGVLTGYLLRIIFPVLKKLGLNKI